MGKELNQAVTKALEIAPGVGRGRATAPKGCLGPLERLALLKLASMAPDDTRLTWPSWGLLRKWMGCSENAVGPALSLLADAGHISIMPERHRVFQVYLVHPGGLSKAPACTPGAITAHLSPAKRRNGGKYFSPKDIQAVIAWNARLGRVEGSAAAVAAILVDAALVFKSPLRSTPLVGADDGQAAQGQMPLTPNQRDKLPQGVSKTPPTSGDEYRIEPEKELIACAGEAGAAFGMDAGGGAVGQPQSEGEGKQPVQRLPQIKARRVSAAQKAREYWQGDPEVVLARVLAEGGPLAERLAAMSYDGGIAEVERTQRQAGVADQTRAAA